MDFFIAANLNKLAANRYLEELFHKGQLQRAYEDDPVNAPSSKDLRHTFEEKMMQFIIRYPTLEFSDFMFMRDLDIFSSINKIMLIIIKYGCDCLIFLDRAVIRWILPTDYKDRTLNYHIKSIEKFVEAELTRLKMPLLRFKTINQARKEGHVVNMAFNRFIRNQYPNFQLDGILIDVNFFIIHLLTRSRSEMGKLLLNTLINVFKASNDHSMYMREVDRLRTMNILYGDKVPTQLKSTLEMEVDNMYPSNEIGNSLSSNFAKIIDEALATTTTSPPLPSADDDDGLLDSELNDDEDDAEEVAKPDINERAISTSVIYFELSQLTVLVEQPVVVKQLKQFLQRSCFCQTDTKRFCILLFYNSEKNVYNLLTRQVHTAKGVLAKQKDPLICGWSGMFNNITKTVLLRDLKLYNKMYKVKKTQIYQVSDLQQLKSDLSHVIAEIEGNRVTDIIAENIQSPTAQATFKNSLQPIYYDATAIIAPLHQRLHQDTINQDTIPLHQSDDATGIHLNHDLNDEHFPALSSQTQEALLQDAISSASELSYLTDTYVPESSTGEVVTASLAMVA